MSYRDPYARAFEQIGQYLAQASQGYGRSLREDRERKRLEQEEADALEVARAQAIQQANVPFFNTAFQNLQGLTAGTPEYENALRLFENYQRLFAPVVTPEEAQAVISGFQGLTGQRVTPGVATPADEFAAGGFLGTPAATTFARAEPVSPVEQLIGQSQAIAGATAEREAAAAAAAGLVERATNLQQNIISELSPELRGQIAQTEEGRRTLAILDEFESVATTNPNALTPDMLFNAQNAFSRARTAAGLPATTASPFMLEFGEDLVTNWSDYGIPAAEIPVLSGALGVLNNPQSTSEQIAVAEQTIVSVAEQVGFSDARAALTPEAQELLGTLRGFATKVVDPVSRGELDNAIKTVSLFIAGSDDVSVSDFIDAQAKGLRIGATVGQEEELRNSVVSTMDRVTADWANLSTAERLSQYRQLEEQGLLDYLLPGQRATYEALTGIEDIPGIAERDRALVADAYANAWDAYERGTFGQVTTDVGREALREIFGLGADGDLDAAMQRRREQIADDRETQRQKDAIEFSLTAVNFVNDRNALIESTADTYTPEQLIAMANKRPEDPVRGAAWDLMGREGWSAAIARAEARVLNEAFDDPNAKAAYDFALTLTRERPETPEERATVLASLDELLQQTPLADPVKSAIFNSVADVFASMDAGLELRNAEALLASDVARAMVNAGYDPDYEPADYLRLNDALVDDLNARKELLRQGDCISTEDRFGITTRGVNADEPYCINMRSAYEQIAGRITFNNRAMQESELLRNYFLETETLPDGTVVRRVILNYEDGTPFQPDVIQRLMAYALETVDGRSPTVNEIQTVANAFSTGRLRIAPDGTLVNQDGIPITQDEPQGFSIPIQNVDDNPNLVVAGERDEGGNLPAVGMEVPIELRLSGMAESSNRPDAVNRREGNYGTYQFSSVGGVDSSGLGGFLRYLDDTNKAALGRLAGYLGLSPNASVSDIYGAMDPGDGQVSDRAVLAWSNFARSGDYPGIERGYVVESYVEPAREFLEDAGVDLDRVSSGLMQVMVDTNIQHGPGNAATIFSRVIDSLDVPEDEFVGWLQIPGNDRVLAQAIMDERFKDAESNPNSLAYFQGAINRGDFTKDQLLNRYREITGQFDELSWYSPSFQDQLQAAAGRAASSTGQFLGGGFGNMAEGARGAGAIVAGAAEAFGEAGAGALAAAPGAVANLFQRAEAAPAPSVSPLFGRRTTGGRAGTSERLRSDE